MRRKAFLWPVLSKAGMQGSACGELEAEMTELFAGPRRPAEDHHATAAHAMPIESPEIISRLLVDHLTEVTRLVAS